MQYMYRDYLIAEWPDACAQSHTGTVMGWAANKLTRLLETRNYTTGGKKPHWHYSNTKDKLSMYAHLAPLDLPTIVLISLIVSLVPALAPVKCRPFS